MDSHAVTQLIVIVILICLSSFFSATETAFSSLNKIRLKNMAQDGNRRAASTLRLADGYDKLLSTILIGNNIVNIAASSIATLFFVKLIGSGSGPTVSTIVLTVVVLIFGEITPKTIAKEMPDSFAMAVTKPMRFLIVIFTPFNFLFSFWQKSVSRLVKVKSNGGMTDDELLTLVDEAQSGGGIGEDEGELIKSAIEFFDLDADEVMTPRVDIVSVEQNDTDEEIKAVFRESGFSRLPVCDKSLDDIIGVIYEKDFYDYLEDGGDRSEAIKSVIYAPKTMKIPTLLSYLQNSKSHMAVIADEYGGTLGIVTIEDIVEELVGEIWDENDEVIDEFRKLGDSVYRISCSANLEKMFELFGIDIEDEYYSNTVSGWVAEELGKIPEEGDSFTFRNLDVTVTKTDSKRALEIEIKVDGDDAEAE